MQFKTFICHFLVITSVTLPTITKAEDALEKKHGIIVTPFTGYRYDVFQWSIPKGYASSGKKISELTWKNHISETGIKIETKPEENRFNFQGQLKYGYILKQSRNQDSDWDDIGEFARSFSNVKGNVFDLSGAVGFSRNMASMLITYYMGIDYSKYKMRNYGLYYSIHRFHNQNINSILGHEHPKSQLVASYNFSNYSPWLGASINYSFNDKFTIIPTVKLYLFSLFAKADWVINEGFKHDPSFTDKAFGIGGSFDTELLYKYSNNLDLRLNVGIKKLVMTKGKKKAFYVDDTISCKLKKLSFVSSSVSAGIKYHF